MKGKTFLLLAAGGSFAVSLLHVGAIVVGPAAYRLLGAGEEFAAWAEAGSSFPALITLGLAGLFAVFGGIRPLRGRDFPPVAAIVYAV
jgi:hypothetical protein